MDKGKWKSFNLTDLFKISLGKHIPASKLEDNRTDTHKFPYITAKTENNGVNGFTEEHNAENVITLGSRGSYKAYYQDKKVWVSNNNVILKPTNFQLNIYSGLYLVTVISHIDRWSYGYNPTISHLQNIKISLPVDINNEIDFEYMETYVKEKLNLNLNKISKPKTEQPIKLKDLRTELIEVGEIFDIRRGYSASIRALEEENGEYPIISSSKEYPSKYSNNTKYVDKDPHAIAINRTGSTAYAKYVKGPFVPTDNVYIMTNNNLNQYSSIYLITLLNKEIYRYPYGRTCNPERISKVKLPIPVDEDGVISWKAMEKFIKSRNFTNRL